MPARNPPAGPVLVGKRTVRTFASSTGSSRPPTPLTTRMICSGRKPSDSMRDRVT